MALAHYYFGVAFENLGDKRRALEHYRRELEVNPLYQPVQEGARRLG